MSIKQANKHVEDVMSEGKQRQKYKKVSIELKTKVAKYAAENTVKLFISDRNPPVFVDMVASNTARKMYLSLPTWVTKYVHDACTPKKQEFNQRKSHFLTQKGNLTKMVYTKIAKGGEVTLYTCIYVDTSLWV